MGRQRKSNRLGFADWVHWEQVSRCRLPTRRINYKSAAEQQGVSHTYKGLLNRTITFIFTVFFRITLVEIGGNAISGAFLSSGR